MLLKVGFAGPTFDIRPMVSLMALGYGLYILRLWPLCFHSQPADGSLLPHSSLPLSSSSIHPISGGPPLSAHKGPGISPGNYLVDENIQTPVNTYRDIKFLLLSSLNVSKFSNHYFRPSFYNDLESRPKIRGSECDRSL